MQTITALISEVDGFIQQLYTRIKLNHKKTISQKSLFTDSIPNVLSFP